MPPRLFLPCVWVAWNLAFPPQGVAQPPAHNQPKPPAQISEEEAAGELLAPKVFRAAAANLRPSIVTLETFGGVDNPAAKFAGPAALGPTTGVIISPTGHVITSTFNLARKPPVITVVLATGERRVAQLLGRDDTRQVCVLKFDPPHPLPVPELAASDEVRVGQWALALGRGYGGQEPGITVGVISAVGRIGGRALQTDAHTSPMNYGGPLVDLDGRLLGICVPLHPTSSAVGAGAEWYDSGIGFAVPLGSPAAWLERLKRGENIHPPLLGVETVAAPEREGALVKKVEPNSPAAALGLQVGDILLALDDVPLFDHVHLRAQLKRFAAGDSVRLAWQHGEKTQEAAVVFAARPAAEPTQEPSNN